MFLFHLAETATWSDENIVFKHISSRNEILFERKAYRVFKIKVLM